MSSTDSTQGAYRNYRKGVDETVTKMLLEKVTQETHDDETSRKSALDTHLENATRLLNGMMQALHHQTSALKDEEEVTNALTQDHQDLIMKTITNMVQTSVGGGRTKSLQWNIQHGDMPMENTTRSIDDLVTSKGIIINGIQQQQW